MFRIQRTTHIPGLVLAASLVAAAGCAGQDIEPPDTTIDALMTFCMQRPHWLRELNQAELIFLPRELGDLIDAQ